MSTTYSISADRKTVTFTLTNPIPLDSTDDHLIYFFLEENKSVAVARFITSDVVGVMRAVSAGQVNAQGQQLFTNLEAMTFAGIEQSFVANVSQHYPASVASQLAAVSSANTSLQTAIAGVVAAQVTL